MNRSFAALAAIAFAAAPGLALAQNKGSATSPNMDYGATQNRPPRVPTASAAPNEIRLGEAMGRTVYGRGGARLGAIDDALLGRETKRLDLVVLGNRLAPWSSLAFEAKPSPRFRADLAKEDLKSAPAGKDRQAYLDVKKDLFGRSVVNERGEKLGDVNDIVVRLNDGEVVAVGVGVREGMVKESHAVDWSAVRSLGDERDKRIVVAIDRDQLAQAPVLTTKAPEATDRSSQGGAANSGGSTRPGAQLDTSTNKFTPAPDARRK